MPYSLNLFEFVEHSKDAKKISFYENLETVLEKVWENRKKYLPYENTYYTTDSRNQRYIDFRKNEIIPRNWIGSLHIKSEGQEYVVNLLPKIFYTNDYSYSDEEINGIFAHILWWLSVSEQKYYSFNESSLDALNTDLLENMIYMYSVYALDVFSVSAYHYYKTVEEELETIKGKIDFSGYVRNYASGNLHRIPCIYDSFQYDNNFNRIVKYVTKLLLQCAKMDQTKRNLKDLLFILDEVEDTAVSIDDCDKVVLNPVFSEYKRILDYCSLFLSSLSVYKWKDDYDVFALLIPCEKLFENFIFNIFKNKKTAPVVKVSRKSPGKSCLVRELPRETTDRYRMLNDIVVYLGKKKYIIFDTKYKKIYNIKDNGDEEFDKVYKISQSDIYQMVSYAVGSGIPDIGLLYPKSIDDDDVGELPVYEIDDALASGRIIRINPFKLNIIHEDGINMKIEGKLGDMFKETENKLVKDINKAISAIIENSETL